MLELSKKAAFSQQRELLLSTSSSSFPLAGENYVFCPGLCILWAEGQGVQSSQEAAEIT